MNECPCILCVLQGSHGWQGPQVIGINKQEFAAKAHSSRIIELPNVHNMKIILALALLTVVLKPSEAGVSGNYIFTLLLHINNWNIELIYILSYLNSKFFNLQQKQTNQFFIIASFWDCRTNLFHSRPYTGTREWSDVMK